MIQTEILEKLLKEMKDRKPEISKTNAFLETLRLAMVKVIQESDDIPESQKRNMRVGIEVFELFKKEDMDNCDVLEVTSRMLATALQVEKKENRIEAFKLIVGELAKVLNA